MNNPRESDHILSQFQEELNQLRLDVLRMASNAQLNLQHALTGLLDRDQDRCSAAIADDEHVDQLEKRIDQEGIRILSLYNPVAQDLRQVVASMKISNDLERISDEAGNIARRARLILRNAELPETHFLEPLYRLSTQLVHEAIHSFAEHDLEGARAIHAKDDELDEGHNKLVKQLRKRMSDDPDRLKDYLDLMFIVRSLERIGDHATNIAEDTIYIESAEDVRHQD